VRQEKSLGLDVADLTKPIMKDDARMTVGRVYPVARGIGSSHENHHPLARDIANPFRGRFSLGRKRDYQREDNNAAKHQPLHIPLPLRAPRQAMRL
jgi:hypothetical protein